MPSSSIMRIKSKLHPHERSALVPKIIPSIKKRKQKTSKRGTMNSSRSFVAEMFHTKNPSKKPQKWSNNDIQLLEKLGISPRNKNRNEQNDNNKLNVSFKQEMHVCTTLKLNTVFLICIPNRFLINNSFYIYKTL